MSYVIGVDVGGTFTDAVAADDRGRIVGAKTPSTPDDYAVGVLDAIAALAAELGVGERDLLADTAYVAHGTTASINALVTGAVEPVGFVTTRGHGDSISIMNVEGRYLGLSAAEIQDVLHTRKPPPLVPRSRLVEATERVDSAGRVVVSLDEADLRERLRRLLDTGVSAVAVSLLWSFQNPEHEHRVREILVELDPEVFVALSSDVSPRIREFARHTTTIMSTQLGPPLRRYLVPLTRQLADRGLAGPLLVMQGSGGTVTAAEAPSSAITTVGSVLSGGVVGAARLAGQLGHRDVITVDMGGTTFLVGMIVGGEPVRTSATVINQQPVNVSTIDVNVLGAGGGALAWIDEGGNLRVGPQSAAADPGPAAYGAGGTRPTVTDADLVLGILDEDNFLGGRRRLHPELAEQALVEHLGRPLGLSAEQAAAAVYEVQNAQAADLARKVVVEAGHDPREFAVYAFGGAGPVHAAAFTPEMGVRELVVPLGAAASGFSAFGLAAADVVVTAELSDPAAFPLDAAAVQRNYDRLESQVRASLARQGVEFAAVDLRREFDARYTAQMFEVTVDAPDGPLDADGVALMAQAFEKRYAELYGAGSGVATAGFLILTYRVRGTGRLAFRPTLPAHATASDPDAAVARTGYRRVFLQVDRGFEETAIYDYRLLRSGHVVRGPAVVEVPTTTVTVPAGRTASVDPLGNLRIDLTEEPRP